MQAPTQQTPSGGGEGGGGEPSLPSPPSLGEFLSSDQGAAWLAITVDEWEQKLLRMKHDAQSASVSGLNGWLQASFNELQGSEKGRILVAKIQAVDTRSLAGFQSTALQVPLLVTEEYVRRRLVRLVSRNARRCFGLFAWRVAVAGLLLEAAKAGVRAAVGRRRRRLRAAVDVMLDVALPTAYFGPALGIWHGVMKLLSAGGVWGMREDRAGRQPRLPEPEFREPAAD